MPAEEPPRTEREEDRMSLVTLLALVYVVLFFGLCIAALLRGPE